MRRPYPLLLVLLLVLLSGCMKARVPEAARQAAYAGEAAMEDYDYGGMAESAAPPPAPSARVMGARSAPASEAVEPAPPPAGEEPAAAERMVHYNGWARIMVARPEDLVKRVAELARGEGGEVERMSPTSVTVRVPVARFQEIFDAVLALGEVLDRSITAEDVTEAYTAVDLRLRTARATRERLMELLARATEEAEKLELLRQIQRLTEEIDVMETQVRLLADLAAFSRITAEAVPRPALGAGPVEADLAGFRWIRVLSPFRKDLVLEGDHLKLEVPEGFVALDDKEHFVAESADGAIFRATRYRNEPEGSAAFWIAAIEERLAEQFAAAEVSTAGDWQVLRLLEAGVEEPYRYLVGVRVEGGWRHLVEVYYPSAAQEERYDAAIRAVLEGRVG